MKHGTIAVSAVVLAALSAPAAAAESGPAAGAGESGSAVAAPGPRPSGKVAATPDPTAPGGTGVTATPPPASSVPTPAPTTPAEPPTAKPKPGAGKKKKSPPKIAKERVYASVSPGDSARYGVGQLVTVDFSTAIERKRAVEQAIRVTSRKALPTGAWGWIDDDTAVYRPRRFWPGNAKIKFSMDLRNVVVGRGSKTKYLGAADKTYVLRTARSFVLRIKDAKHRMYVERDGKVIKSFPVSLGKSAGGYQTRSGIKIITGDKSAALRMRGTDRVSGETWDVVAPYSTRLTPTGEYIHGAPWANSRMGLWNGSHGCTNMYVADAKWIFDRVRAGDPTVTTGTGRPMEVWNGTPGAFWNYSWKEWRAKSAR